MKVSEHPRSSGPPVRDGAPSALCVPGLVQRQAALTPGALALACGLDSVTYADLEQRSNRLAHYLCTLGVHPGSLVGLCLDRSLDFPVAALAILKAGAAYLPLETRTPSQRLKTMLDAAQVSLVVTQAAQSEWLKSDGRTLVAMDRDATEIGRCSTDAVPVRVKPEDLAYVIYTSGSTGTPKAVAVGHDSLLNLIIWHNRTFGVTPNDRATQLASIGFDAAVWELWPYLVTGASVHIVDDETRADAERLRDWLVREKITVSFAPTPLAERLIQSQWPRATALRFLLTGADTLHHFPPPGLPFALVNNYGPTECTVVATSAIVPAQGSLAESPSIGRPITNAEVHVLDGAMKPVPDGKLGEIYIGGAGLAKGYLNDPALSAERFVTHPFKPGGRLYRTGDLGRYLPDGQIAFHGRNDDQVKIRGYRIEMNEVASALRRHPAIRETIVVASNGVGDRQLVAYVVLRSTPPALAELQHFLSQELPDYMLPAKFVPLDALPLAASGKVDRAALPAPNDANILRDVPSPEASNPTEQRVAEIVASLLGLARVGLKDNFFYLGGNSLFGTQVIARLRDAFGIELPLLKLFDHPTASDLAAEVERLMIEKIEAMSEDDVQRLLSQRRAS